MITTIMLKRKQVIMLHEYIFHKSDTCFFKENNFSIMSQNRHTPTSE